jgi:hypothetical protein
MRVSAFTLPADHLLGFFRSGSNEVKLTAQKLEILDVDHQLLVSVTSVALQPSET